MGKMEIFLCTVYVRIYMYMYMYSTSGTVVPDVLQYTEIGLKLPKSFGCNSLHNLTNL